MPKTTTRTPRKPRSQFAPGRVDPFVVYVNYPNSQKEYAYLVNLPNVTQGSILNINGCDVTVVRTAQSDPRAVKWIHSRATSELVAKRRTIMTRLRQLYEEEQQLKLFTSLRSPEAKRLIKELKSLKSEYLA